MYSSSERQRKLGLRSHRQLLFALFAQTKHWDMFERIFVDFLTNNPGDFGSFLQHLLLVVSCCWLCGFADTETQ